MENSVIALAQLPFRWMSEMFKQKEVVEQMYEEAALKGVDIICFPETIFALSIMDCTDIVHQFISPLSKKAGVWTIVGTVTTSPVGKHNSSLVFNRQGELVGKYHKRHILGGEKDQGFVSGSEPLIMEMDEWKVGVVICYDIFSPKVIADYQDQGVQILFVLSNMVVPMVSLLDRQQFLVGEAFPAWTAAQLNCFVAISMVLGEDVISCSQVVSPTTTIARLDDKEGLVVAELPFRQLDFFPMLDLTQDELPSYVEEKFPQTESQGGINCD